MILLRRENAARDRGDRDEVIVPAGEGGAGLFIDEDNKKNRVTKSEGEVESNEEDLKRRRNGVFGSVEEARREKGDLWSGFRYSL